VTWRVELARDARKELARLPTTIQKRIARALLSLEKEPLPAGCKKLRTGMAGAFAWAIIESSTSQTRRRERSSWE
jgi:mRNA-degrading endonuclease RelE of RelBE toxin-antitoxin system